MDCIYSYNIKDVLNKVKKYKTEIKKHEDEINCIEYNLKKYQNIYNKLYKTLTDIIEKEYFKLIRYGIDKICNIKIIFNKELINGLIFIDEITIKYKNNKIYSYSFYYSKKLNKYYSISLNHLTQKSSSKYFDNIDKLNNFISKIFIHSHNIVCYYILKTTNIIPENYIMKLMKNYFKRLRKSKK